MVRWGLLTFFSSSRNRISGRRQDVRKGRTLHRRGLIVPRNLVRSPPIHCLLVRRNRYPQAQEACMILIGRLRLPFLVGLTLTPPWALLWKLAVPWTSLKEVQCHLERVSLVCPLVRHADCRWRPKLVIHASIHFRGGNRHHKRGR